MTNRKPAGISAMPEQKLRLAGGVDAGKSLSGFLKNKGAELPVQKPEKPVAIRTMDVSARTNSAQEDTSLTGSNEYVSLNDQIWGEGGTGWEGYEKQVEAQKQNTPAAPFTKEELMELYKAADVDPALMTEYSHRGGYTENRDTAVNGGGTGQPAEFYREGTWYYYDGTPRMVKPGTSGADERFLSDGNLQLLGYFQKMYEGTDSPEEKAYWHSMAERLRAGANYSGGVDGSLYLPGTSDGETQPSYGSPGGTDSYGDTSENRMEELLNAWRNAAQAQSDASVDYAVRKAVAEYERILADAQGQFKEQAENVSREERQTMDNAALYAELRGDKGGIGQEQYSSIQNAAAQNRLAVQQAQTKLSTDTARMIEDLRVQGEFEKAEKAFEITQEYLARLMEMEQWAAEYHLSAAQFNESVRRWEAEYELTMERLELSEEQWAKEMALKEKEYEYDRYLSGLGLAQTEKSELADIGWAMLELGMVPDQRYLDAMELDAAAAEKMMEMLAQTNGETTDYMDPAVIYRALYDADFTDESDLLEIADYLRVRGVKEEWVNAYAREYVARGYARTRRGLAPYTIGQGITPQRAQELGYQSWDEIKSAAHNTQNMGKLLDLFSRVYRDCNEEQLNYFYDLITHRTMTREEQSRFVNMIEEISDYNPLAADYID